MLYISYIRKILLHLTVFILSVTFFYTLVNLLPKLGLQATYYLGKDFSGNPAAQRTDRNFFFENKAFLRSIYTSHWRPPYPEKFPEHSIEWNGFIKLPESGEYIFLANFSENLQIFINGENLALKASGSGGYYTGIIVLPEGKFPFRMLYSGTEQEGHLKLLWIYPGKPVQYLSKNPVPSPVPLQIFSAPQKFSLPRGINIFLYLFIILFVLLINCFILFRTEFKVYIHNHANSLILAIILGAGFLIRTVDYSIVPYFNETADEFNHSYNGYHVLNGDSPLGWSWYNCYKTGMFKEYFGFTTRLVSPFFDWPPLYSVMVGALMHIFVSNGEPPLYSMDLIRIPPIIISTVNILLVFFLAKKILGTRTAILSALVYAMLPVIVVSGHLSKDEQLITSFFITALIFAWRDLNKTGTSNKDILLSASFSGLSILAKITGIAIPMTIAGLYISRRQWKKASFFFASTVFFVLIYLGYGALYDFKSLISVLSYQSSIAFSSLRGCLRLITEARLVLEPVNAGWYILLWFSVIYMIFKHPLKSRILAIPLFLYLFFIATAIPFDLDYGWYRIPLYPFLAIGGASLFASFIKNPDFFKGSIITALGILPDFQNSLTQGISGSSNKIRLLVFMLLSPLILKYIISNESYARFVKVWAWLILILSAVLWVFNVRYFTDLYHPLHAF